MTTKPKILVVDDEDTLRYFLRLNLQEHHYHVLEAADGQTALNLIQQHDFDVALVDLHLTDMDGLEIMRYLRRSSPKTSVIILTGHASVDSAVAALRQGAHDYLTKPYDSAELLASVADGVARSSVNSTAVVQPTAGVAVSPLRGGTEGGVLEVKDLKLNLASREVTRAGRLINLTPTEFDLLSTLMAQPDTAIDAITLIKQVRGYEATEADARAIARVHIHRLRHKVETDPANPEYVTTVAGGRYLLKTR